MSYDFSFKLEQPKKTAKQALFNIGVKTLRVCGAPQQISFLGFNYDIVNKLREEINKLDEATAQKALDEIRGELDSTN